jgi:DNA repair and recombination RAD54-like protein
MLRSYPSLPDGKIVDKLAGSTRVNQPYKPPSLARRETEKPQRKRKRVSYKENTVGDGSDSDGGSSRKRRKSMGDAETTGADNVSLLNRYPVYKPKPFNTVFGGEGKKFAIPSITGKDGRIIRHASSNASLGLRVQPIVPPRPLHDPMADHAIVLYDPTIDDRETEEEKQERLKEEAREAAAAEAAEKSKGLFNPHKSLRLLLGEDKKEKNKVLMKKQNVPVVIDPLLSKVLRPHQIEGVKVGGFFRHLSGFNRFEVLVPLHDWHDV